jgi:hypothetical protein
MEFYKDRTLTDIETLFGLLLFIAAIRIGAGCRRPDC